MLSDRFGAFEAIANSSIKLARVAPEEELAMEPIVAEAILEFADDLRTASRVAGENSACWVAGVGGCTGPCENSSGSP
jgi:hypothetical protein